MNDINNTNNIYNTNVTLNKCIVCDSLYNLQICTECDEYVCLNKECLDPECTNTKYLHGEYSITPSFICCLICYQEKISMEMEEQMNNGQLDQLYQLDKCIYCENIFYYNQNCDCYQMNIDDIDNKFISNEIDLDDNNNMILEDIENIENMEDIENIEETLRCLSIHNK